MLRIAKYTKPYLLLILITIALLFIQANADLALPDYLSKIVNNGIQQSGVENAVPLAIRQSEMDKLTIFMTISDSELVLSHYTLVDQNSADYEKYLQDYPELANQPVYILNPVDKTVITTLTPIMGKALLIVSSLTQIQADPSKAASITGWF